MEGQPSPGKPASAEALSSASASAPPSYDPDDPCVMPGVRPPDRRTPAERRRDFWFLQIGVVLYALVGWLVARWTERPMLGLGVFAAVTFVASIFYFRGRRPEVRD
ncbi:MAG: hypothetical protein HY719_14320 [Planctomycetes bacterium]|nr:hypothetical protein [Planctomycetota bacterium]